MHEELWAGADLKVEYAWFHLRRMGQSIEPPERNDMNVALQASGAIIDTGWQVSFYAHLDAFLSAARSVPEIIQCCFGKDPAKVMKDWFDKLPAEEQVRRREFAKQFKKHYEEFRAPPLGTARHISEHRTGLAPVKVAISGLFGVIYTGSPASRVPISETRQIDDPTVAFLAKPIPLQPRWDDFDIQGQPLFPACQEYLARARALVEEARHLSRQVHTCRLSSPPT